MEIIIENENEEQIIVLTSDCFPYKVGDKIFITQDVKNKEIWNEDIIPIDIEVEIINICHSIKKMYGYSKGQIGEIIYSTVTVKLI